MTSTRRSTLVVLSPLLYATIIFGILYCYVTLQRVPIWITEQQQQLQQQHILLLTTTTATQTIIQSNSKEISEHDKLLFDNNNYKNNKNNTINETSLLCPTSPPIWPNSLIITQRRIPDMDSKVGPAITVTYYDYNFGANLIQIYPDDDDDMNENNNVLWDLELNSGHSYYFTPSKQTCTPIKFSVGILRPDFLQDNDTIPLGPSYTKDSNKLVCGWTKANFIDYYIDPITNIPDSWYFHTMKATFQVLNYTTTATATATTTTTTTSNDNNNNIFNNTNNQSTTLIDPSLFIPPKYCF